MPFVHVAGWLRTRRASPGRPDQGLPGIEGPVDPGWGIEEGRPDQGLPGGGGPVDPGWGVGIERPDQGLPRPPRPPQIWPPIQGPVDPGWGFPLPPVIDNTLPPTVGHPLPIPPDYPAHLPARPGRPVDPGYGIEEGRPGQGLPVHPDQLPVLPPLGIWPPPAPVHPSHPIYPVPPGAPDQGLPGGGGTAGQLPVIPPGAVWPPLPPEIGGKIICFAWVVGVGYRWVVLDPSLEVPVQLPTLPNRPPVAQPK